MLLKASNGRPFPARTDVPKPWGFGTLAVPARARNRDLLAGARVGLLGSRGILGMRYRSPALIDLECVTSHRLKIEMHPPLSP
jgi:hypothetical protein